MRSSTAILSFLSAFPTLSYLANAFVYPAGPVSDTVWKPNTNVVISWLDDKQEPMLSSNPIFDVFLMTGADDHQTKLATIATNVNGGTTKSIKYQVPYVSPPGQIYFLMFQTKDQKATAWATRFTITDINGNPGTLRPVIPPGGKVNPGGNGTIITLKQAQSPKAHKQSPKAHKQSPVELANEPKIVSTAVPGAGSSSSSVSSSASLGVQSSPASSSTSSSASSVGGQDKPALVNVGEREKQQVNLKTMHNGSNSVSMTAAASSTAMVAFVGFAVLLGF
ncbi:hypothetical protein EDD11_003362 [Mortierella claussenii]|nr:hypothetical protein EDD11_003362 [Mortierella claussenii]